MDVIGVYSAEVHEVVASCGTALTNDQVRSLKRHSDKIVVNFDPDNAGAKAAERSIQMLLEEGMHIKVLELEGKLDPDEYIAEHGAEHYRYKLQHAASYFGWLADRSRRQFDMSTAEGRMQGFQYLLPAIQRVHDKLERLTIANEMAAYLGVKDTEVLEHLRRSPTGTKQSEGPKLPQVPPLEKLLVRILIRNTEARDEMLPRMRGGQMRTARIVDAIRAAARPGQDLTFTEIDSQLDEGNKNLLHSMAFADDTDESNLTLEQAWLCWQKIQMGDRQARRMQLKAGIEAAEREKRFNDALQLIKELSELEREPE
jgi:DNA primase